MIRKIVHIHEERCSGCGACADACHEGAIAMINGIARLIKDDYCDGLGDCLPACPENAIEIIEREAAEYDEAAVAARTAAMKKAAESFETGKTPNPETCSFPDTSTAKLQSQLQQWPCQIRLVPAKAPYFNDAKLLIAADCTAFAYGNFHNEFMKDHVTVIGCPKLDPVDYSEKLTEIIKQNDIREVTLARMEVPCCGGLQYALTTAIKNSGKTFPVHIKTISCSGELI